MTDTPQPVAAGENATLEDGAAAFKALLNPQPAATRDEGGRFASPNAETDQADDEEQAEQAQAPDDGDDTGDADETDDAPDEGQQDDVPMPASWSKEDEADWQALPPETRAKLATREGQRETAVNAKFQESANARRQAEQHAAEANANRDRYAQAIDEVSQLVTYPEPNPVDYGLGTEGYDRDSYDLAHYQWRQAQATLGTLAQQRQAIAAQQAQEDEQARRTAHAEIEQVAWPKFVDEVPDLAVPGKGQKIVSELVQYAKEAGIPADVFDGAAGKVTSTEMHLIWKAREYDRIKAAKTRVAAGNPPPKPAGPVVKPGGVIPRQTIQANRLGKAQERLAKSGSIDDAAAVFRNLGF